MPEMSLMGINNFFQSETLLYSVWEVPGLNVSEIPTVLHSGEFIYSCYEIVMVFCHYTIPQVTERRFTASKYMQVRKFFNLRCPPYAALIWEALFLDTLLSLIFYHVLKFIYDQLQFLSVCCGHSYGK
jgi:hypothetical protein